MILEPVHFFETFIIIKAILWEKDFVFGVGKDWFDL